MSISFKSKKFQRNKTTFVIIVLSFIVLAITFAYLDFKHTNLSPLLQLVIIVLPFLIPTILYYFGDEWNIADGVKNASKKWAGLHNVIKEAHEWVDEHKLVIRTEHTLTLTIKKYDKNGKKAVIIEREHNYCIHNPDADKEYDYKNFKVTADLGGNKKYPDDEVKSLRGIDQSVAIDDLDKRGGLDFTPVGIHS